MDFDPFHSQQQFRQLWDDVRIERASHYSLFTFGDSDLPYYLLSEPAKPGDLVGIHEGAIKISRPLIFRPDADRPEFENFFQEEEEGDDSQDYISFLLARTAAFSNLRFSNTPRASKFVSDSVEETVDRLSRQLDDEEEDRMAIIISKPRQQGFALMKYAIQQVIQSTPGNISELRERGFLN